MTLGPAPLVLPQDLLGSDQNKAGMLAVRMRLRNRYRIQKVLGRGGQCQVYLASDDQNNGAQVVVKNLIYHSHDPHVREEELELFRQEAEILGVTSHPSLPRLVEAFVEDDSHYVVEEYVGNTNLDALLQARGGPLTPAEVAWMAHDMLDLLAYLHNLDPRVVLRDIKPSNITCQADRTGRIDAESRFWFVDLSISMRYRPGEPDRVKMGSPGYAPPEQYRGHSQPRSDLYALAVTMLTALTAHDPMSTPFAMPAPCSLRPSLDTAWDRFMQRGLALDATSRFRTAQEMSDELERLLPRSRARAPAAVPTPPMATAVQRPGRHAWSSVRVAVLLVAAMLVLLGLLGGFNGHGGESGNASKQTHQTAGIGGERDLTTEATEEQRFSQVPLFLCDLCG